MTKKNENKISDWSTGCCGSTHFDPHTGETIILGTEPYVATPVVEYRLKEVKRWSLSRYHKHPEKKIGGSDGLGIYDNLPTALSIMAALTKSEHGSTNNASEFEDTLPKVWHSNTTRMTDRFLIDQDRELLIFEGDTWVETHDEVQRWVEMTNKMFPVKKHYKVEPIREMVGTPKVVAIRKTWDEIAYSGLDGRTPKGSKVEILPSEQTVSKNAPYGCKYDYFIMTNDYVYISLSENGFDTRKESNESEYLNAYGNVGCLISVTSQTRKGKYYLPSNNGRTGEAATFHPDDYNIIFVHDTDTGNWFRYT